ncbi:FUSC family protein [Thermostaphylospora chromogena]|uniref:Uncharacterized membrane protein YgaE, UPF0421/DUF939 family n=1 Tax=Thermostaphylospora chromogena TaxID=35622 RepID=A0A1H1GWY6_9ACTN|nr:FUSC family protein [Thermostaphylospora chromogena]SDR17346.1 Uncharacterized membrane protein YgaE, UPF0421/DUF939 family [Thermostaphylospora chromogena]
MRLRRRLRDDLQARWRRLLFMLPTVLQSAVAAALAWTVAKDLLGHPRPFFAPIAAVICVGVALGRRLRRLFELVVGVSVGIGVGDLLVLHIGSGSWQIALVVALAMSIAVLLDSGTLFSLQAGTSAVLVATLLPPTDTGGLERMVDALVGGGLGIAAIALLPASPATLVYRHASRVLDALAAVLQRTAQAIEDSDADLAADALRAARQTQKVIDEFEQALRTGREIVTISPLRWQWRRMLLRYETARAPVDHAVRNARVLARRTAAAIQREAPVPPALPRALVELAKVVRLLRDDLGAGRDLREVREEVTRVAALLSRMTGRSVLSVDVMIAQVRSIVIDLLEATGADRSAARAALPPEPAAAEPSEAPRSQDLDAAPSEDPAPGPAEPQAPEPGSQDPGTRRP